MRKIVLCFMAILVLFVGCGKKESKEATTEGKEVKTIGIAMPTKSSQRWIDDGNNMVKEFEALGYKVDLQYAEDVVDEFIKPTVISDAAGNPIGKIHEGDSFIFFNYRPDRARQLAKVMVDPDFDGFARGQYPKTDFVCMRQYDSKLNAKVAYEDDEITNTFGEVVSKAGLTQLRTAETEKYAHVTFFFNGGKEAQFPGEDRILVPSPKVATYDLQPEMSAYELTDKVLEALSNDLYDVVVMNYANPDMVGHTGVVEAAKKAVAVVDECFGKIAEKILEKDGVLLVTADHGNVDLMVDPVTGVPFTQHTTNQVPLLFIIDTKMQNLHLMGN